MNRSFIPVQDARSGVSAAARRHRAVAAGGVGHETGSPEGAVRVTPVATGTPRLGVPSAFQVIF